MTTLLVCADEWDPYLPGISEQAAGVGPALAAALAMAPPRMVLLVPLSRADVVSSFERAAAQHAPAMHVAPIPIPLAGDALVTRLSEILTAESANGALSVCLNTGPDTVREAWRNLRPSAHPVRWVTLQYVFGKPAVLVEEKTGPARSAVREPVVTWSAATPHAPAPDLATACLRLGLRGEDPAFRAVLEMAARLAPHPVPLLIQGETGTGKGLLAALLHELSGRARAPFVAVNCAALPETLVESILFGHRKGSFTGAATDQPGKFVLADGGTLFLDEIGELPLSLQAKLLRVLEDGVVEPIGATRGTPVDVRIVAATHRDLRAAVAEKTFREDLFFRLGFAQLTLPPLRARAGDIRKLALYQLTQLNRALPQPRRLDASAMARLEAHSWPGNIRELANVLGRSVLLSTRSVLQADDLLMDPLPTPRVETSTLPDVGPGFSLDAYLAEVRRALIERALAQANGNKSQAARLLGISPQAVHKFTQNPNRTASTDVEKINRG